MTLVGVHRFAVALSAGALLALPVLAHPPAAAAAPETFCSSIAVATRFPAPAVYTYRIGVSTGPAACGTARSVLRVAVGQPVFASRPSATVDGWKCSLWTGGEPWVVSCIHGAVVAHAYGPVLEHDPWLLAAASSTMPVLEPAAAPSLGFRLQSVTTKPTCRNTVPQQEVTAVYDRADGATLTIDEQKPQCGNLGLSPVLSHWRIHGREAVLLEYCTGPLGCSRSTGDYALHWQERGDDIVIFTHAVRQSELLAVAQSMTIVAH